jgi:type VI secretion system protein ImpC
MSAQLQAQTGALLEGTSLLDDIVAQSKVAKSDTEHARAKDIISELVKEVLDGTVVVSENLSANIDARIADIDQLISDQLSEVMHAAEFQKLESTWTGLQYLCKQSSTGEQLKIKVFNTTKKELVKDF